MNKIFDVIVLGLGAHGSSTVYNLSKTSCKVLGIDQFTPPHSNGSSHGQSRIIRQAYYENPLYVPFVKEAYDLWQEIEQVSGKELLLKTGGLMLGGTDSTVITGATLSAETHSISYEYLDNKHIKETFPAFRPTENTVGILETDAGILYPEACISAYLGQARKNGAQLQFDESVIRILPTHDCIEITTGKDRYITSKLIVSAGAWLNHLLPELNLPLTIERQVLYWFNNKDEKSRGYFMPGKLPIFIWECSADEIFYGFPDLCDGIKLAFYHGGQSVIPGTPVPSASEEEIAAITAVVGKYLNMEGVFNYSVTCMYTNTPDKDFIIDFHPDNKNIIIASPCSGHGFKFASVTGKILSNMALGRTISFDLSPFAISRFSNA